MEGFEGKIEGITEHAFQFHPFSVLDVSGSGVKLLQQMVLSRQRLHHGIRVHVTAGAYSRPGYVFFPFVGSGADDHQECPDIFAEDFAGLRDGERTFPVGAGRCKADSHQNELIVERFCIFSMQAEGASYRGKALRLETHVGINVVLVGSGLRPGFHNHGE